MLVERLMVGLLLEKLLGNLLVELLRMEHLMVVVLLQVEHSMVLELLGEVFGLKLLVGTMLKNICYLEKKNLSHSPKIIEIIANIVNLSANYPSLCIAW